jgi:hypothetical protein
MNISNLTYFFKNEKFYILGFLRKSIIFGKRQKGGTKMRKKGQAAMEFLMTYGWAILAAIIVIGVLAIYFRPSALTQDSFVMSAPWYGVGLSTTDDGTDTVVSVAVKNQAGEDMTPTGATLSIDDPSGVTCTDVTAAYALVSAGGEQEITFNCDTVDGANGGNNGESLGSGTRFTGTASVTFQRAGSNFAQQSTGSISGSVAA